ncbi:hypothetical protein QW131_21280 [Roseibium salinum]|nr:hypothetical protein [Roseibium salinum]
MSRLSVKIRILALSLFTIVGLLAIGAAFFWSQNELNTAFARMSDSATLAEQVAGLSQTGGDLRAIEKRYLSTPSSGDFQAFDAKLAESGQMLARIADNPAASAYTAELADLKDTLEGTKGAFEMLDAVQQKNWL